MKLDFDTAASRHAVTAYGEGWIRVGDHRITIPCVVTAAGIIPDLLPSAVGGLTQQHFARLAELNADIVLLGTGAQQQFVDYAYVDWLAEQRIGLEMMDTGAACRAYNVLVSEGRAVAAALYMI